MNNFARSNNSIQLFEDVEDGNIKLYLRQRQGMEEIWSKNPNNSLSFDSLVDQLSNMPILVYFQKQKQDPQTGRMRQKLIIQISDERAVEIRTALWTINLDAFNQVYCLSIGKIREIDFFNAPTKNTICKQCRIHFIDPNESLGANDAAFIQLIQDIDKMEIPIQEINKTKDQQIWTQYVKALKRLIRQKEQVWKIQKIGQSYSERIDQYSQDRANFIDISINEKDVAEQFEKELRDYFGDEELEDYGVSERSAFIEFNSYRELNDEEYSVIQDIAQKYFFQLSEESPINNLSGEFKFKYADGDSQSLVIDALAKTLAEEYEIELKIDESGYILNKASEVPHISKILSDKFGFIANLYADRRIHHQVVISSQKINVDYTLLTQVKIFCKENGLDRAFVRLGDGQIIIEVGAFVPNNFLESFGLRKVQQISRFASRLQHYKYAEVPDTNIVDGIYECGSIKTREQSIELLNAIKQANNDATFFQKPTRYIFEVGEMEQDKERSREFKSGVDTDDKVYYNFKKNDLIITPESKEEYQYIISDIRSRFPDVFIENKDFSISYKIQFGRGDSSHRETIINNIKSIFRQNHITNIEFDVIRNFTRVLFTYQFKITKDREDFVALVKRIAGDYKSVLDLSFEKEDGSSTYQFIKDESLEADHEKEILKNVRRATFIFMTHTQYQEYQKSLERFGEDAFVKNAIQIGSFVRKTKNRFTFKLSDEFDKILNDVNGLPQEEIRRGYIKPIFPGELTNIDRMVKAMEKVTNPGQGRNGFPVNRNLPNFIFDPSCARISDGDLEEEKRRILANLNERRLVSQPKQLEAVAKAMLAKDMALIQGPPGTGKTTVIAEIIWQTLSRFPGYKILVTSQTNLAVDNALERLKGKKLVRPIRIGKAEKFEDEGKVYSSDRLTQWFKSKPNSVEETSAADNAIVQWIKNVQKQCSTSSTYKEIVDLWTKLLDSSERTIKDKFFHSYLEHINVFAATCSECGSRNFSEIYQQIFQRSQDNIVEPEFDVVIMDEASKATPPELILPLTLGKKVIIIGDHKQLPPMIDENEFAEALDAVGAKQLVEDWTKADYKISQFEKLFVNAADSCVASLDTQFRMHKQIMDCISQFYRDQKQLVNGLVCGIEGDMDNPDTSISGSRWHGLELRPFIDPDVHAIWVNVSGTENRIGTSYENLDEIEAIKIVLRVLQKSNGFNEYFSRLSREEAKEIGIITYYMPQMQKIKSALYPTLTRAQWKKFELHKYENEFNMPFRINTVDRFQGMERNIIIISTVRSNLPQRHDYKWNKQYPFALGFAREIPRVNVGFSRAKHLLIVIGNEAHFAHKQEYAEAISRMHRIDIEQIINL